MRQKVVKTTYRGEIIKGYTEIEGDLLKLTLASKKWPLITYPYNRADYNTSCEDLIDSQDLVLGKLVELHELALVLNSESQTSYIVKKYFSVMAEMQHTLINKQEYELLRLKIPMIKSLSSTERDKLLSAINDSYHSFKVINEAAIAEVFNNGQREFSQDLFTQFIYYSEINKTKNKI